ncbi:hypothetical protein HC891_22395, partial [Candidatus Gracilibacteria bacterium]|nr:hypothetical protein [Candidatus Gracilibacteria bacterium]
HQPRWLAAPRDTITDAYVAARHAASDAYVAYHWRYQPLAKGQPGRILVEATGSGSSFTLRILLPTTAKKINGVTLNGQAAAHRLETIGASRYLVVEANSPIVQVQVTFDGRRIQESGFRSQNVTKVCSGFVYAY